MPPSPLAEALSMMILSVAAQAAQQGSMEMRHFWHVFIAYAAAWVLVFGWVVAILRRLARVEDKLGR